MALPRSFKTDESFLEKLAMGSIGTRRIFEDLKAQGHDPIELERGSMSHKVWKAIKIKRVRVPDLFCLRCGGRVESRAKAKLEITMSHSLSDAERGWDAGLDDADFVALVHCERGGSGEPTDWSASNLVQYIRVAALRKAFRAKQIRTLKAKGAQEGFEVRVCWPAIVAQDEGQIEAIGPTIRLKKAGAARIGTLKLNRRTGRLMPLVKPGDSIRKSQILAAVVPVSSSYPCPGDADIARYVELSTSTRLSDRYASVKALGRLTERRATEALLARVQDEKEHVYVRVDAAGGLARRQHSSGLEFLRSVVNGEYLTARLEAVIVLGEVKTPDATKLLIDVLRDPEQNAHIRAGAAWSLGEAADQQGLAALVESFRAMDTVIKIEAARALAKLARQHLDPVLGAFTASTVAERPGVAWALSKSGGFTIRQLLPALVDEDSRHWISYMVGSQPRDTMLAGLEELAQRDPSVYFAVTVLWKILSSWVYGLEEY